MYIEHEFIKPNSIEKRLYQRRIADSCLKRSTLVVLPTGMGKTVIALLVIAEVLKSKGGKVLFLAPTKPLVEQHKSFLEEFLLNTSITLFTGEVSPKKRLKLWDEHQVIVSTPQVIQNDLISGKIDLKPVSLIVFDEAHRAVGNYAYVFVSERFKEQNGLALGITASPGNKTETILEVCKNLNITGVEIRSEFDYDVKPYIHDIKIEWVRVDVPYDVREITKLLREVLEEKLKELKKFGLVQKTQKVSTKEILEIQKRIQGRIKASSSPAQSLFYAATLQASAIKVNHALELAETQGINALTSYFERLENEATSKHASKAAKSLIRDARIKRAMSLSKLSEMEHPKVKKVVEIVKEQLRRKRDSHIIVFTHYRDTSELIMNELNTHDDIKAVRFVGQASRNDDKGLSQKEQVELIQMFRSGDINVLVATSVAEEGLDIPSTDLVVFYEPVPSEIRTIQRRGRTGRRRPGRVVILITKNTRDEAYYWSSRHKEKRMRYELQLLRKELSKKIEVGKPEAVKEEKDEAKQKESQSEVKKRGQLKLLDFKDEGRSIIVDTREFNSEVVKELSRKGIAVAPEQLDIADYIISDRVGVERKEVKDFLQSLIDGRLFQQVRSLKQNFIRPVLIIEGNELFTVRNIKESAIFGALASIVADYGLPIIFTRDAKESAEFLNSIIGREFGEKRYAKVRGEKATMPLRETQQFIIEGLPNISSVLAQRLLSHFGSVKEIIDADVDALMEVKGIGRKTAEEIVRVCRSRYLS